MGLVGEVEAILKQFRGVFRRRATFHWFVVIMWAFMLRMEAFGITSLVRCLGLASAEYYNLLHFFHSTAFHVQALCTQWTEIVKQYTQPIRIDGLPLYVVDGLKVGKAGRKMPGVKLLHQESTDNTKPEHIMGHFWGAISSLVSAGQHVFALPLQLQIQDGLKRSPAEKATLIDKMHALVTQMSSPGALVIADAYYATQGSYALFSPPTGTSWAGSALTPSPMSRLRRGTALPLEGDPASAAPASSSKNSSIAPSSSTRPASISMEASRTSDTSAAISSGTAYSFASC